MQKHFQFYCEGKVGAQNMHFLFRQKQRYTMQGVRSYLLLMIMHIQWIIILLLHKHVFHGIKYLCMYVGLFSILNE